MVDAIEIGYAIKDRRDEFGLTQAQFAEAAGVSKRCVWSLELGKNPGVQLNKLTAVLQVLNLDLTISSTGVAKPTMRPEKNADSASRETTDTTLDAAADGKGLTIDAIAILTGSRR